MRHTGFLAVCTIVLCNLVSLTVSAQAPQPPRVVSPERGPDNSVTFRLYAPEAKKVQLTSGGDIPQIPPGQNLDLNRTDSGVWELTIGPMNGGAYRYTFNLDGVRVLDPSSAMVSASNDNAWSYLHVPGQTWMDTQEVPHGAVSEVTYYSSALGRHRRMHVYTPPGFGSADTRYPVFYLLHGAGDSDDSWSTVGRAGFILDNLIAEGKAVPMLVVMPAGHTENNARGMQMADFVKEFGQDIKPYIESNYPVRTERDSTALAGLSMGGAQTLDIAFANLGDYAHVGVYSSGVFGITTDNSWETSHQQVLDDAALKPGLELLWFATGSEDFLLDTTKATVAMLEKHDFDVEYLESGGGHTWINWREYLNSFASRLFK